MKRSALVLFCLLALGRPVWAQGANPVIVLGGALAPNMSQLIMNTVTCGTTSTPFNVTGLTYIAIQVPSGGLQVCFATNTTAATTAPPSKCYPAGTDFQAAGGTGTCIVSAGTQAIAIWTK